MISPLPDACTKVKKPESPDPGPESPLEQVIISLLRGMDARVRSVERELRHMQVQAKTAPIALASLPEIDQSTGLWGALSGGLPPIGMPDFRMPDLGGVPGLGDIKAPDFSNMRWGECRRPHILVAKHAFHAHRARVVGMERVTLHHQPS